MPSILRALAIVLLVGAAAPPLRAADSRERVDFNLHIRPLLSDRCFACHGPDDKARKGKLDLRTRDAALRGGKSGEPSVKPGDPAHSELLRRLTTTDADDVMPPPESKLPPLTPAEIELFRRWIAEGAEFKDHWAFISLHPIEVPTPSPSLGTPANEIDAFVLARLEKEGLQPRPPADRDTLLRRLTLDLTGLPPTPEELDAFRADAAPNAYETVVDRLLDSPRYGERMAQEWMDLARYADTYGYQADVDRDLSPWRDWVIRAFNTNLPWDQFITWQLAGDLLDHPTRDQVLATAFNRLHRQTNEGGSIEEEFRAEYVADRVHTMGTAFLGLTLECARCHDHKYDPISQRDYYGLAGFFNSIDESGLYSHFTRATPTPVQLLWDGDAETKHAAVTDQIAALERRLADRRENAPAAARAWAAQNPEATRGVPPAKVHLRFEELAHDRTPDAVSTNSASTSDAPELVEGRFGKAMRFSGDNSATIPHTGKFGRYDPFSYAFWIQPTEKQHRAVVFHWSRAWSDSGSRGYELVLDDGRPSFALIHFWPGNALAVRAKQPLPLQAWSHLAVTYDGSSRASGLHLYLDGQPLETEVVRDHLYKDIQHRAEWGDADAGGIQLTLAGRFRDNGFKNGLLDEFQGFDVELTPGEVGALARANPGTPPAPSPTLPVGPQEFFARLDPEAQKLAAELHAARVAENNLITPVREIMVMQEMSPRRTSYVLRRGAYDAPTDPVNPTAPERILPMDPSWPKNRLGLARWFTDPRHPLTARVAANRLWKLHFGRGLTPTTWDFGAQGQIPSHPELLDWLAGHYQQSGWNRKALHKLIVMSNTYRQTSTAAADLVARDPENRLLARGPKHRLDAEQIRDSALAASGLLVAKIGGPSVKPYQPPGVWEEAGTGKTYTQDKGESLYRRSLYTFWRRTAPPPSMLTFDATTREVCTAKREVTSTPLQSLVLLNDVQFLEAARVLAEQVLANHPADATARARDAFRRLTGRFPDAKEGEILGRLYTEQSQYFSAHPEAATKYLTQGERPPKADLPPADLAATAVLASAVMNHDAFVTKR